MPQNPFFASHNTSICNNLYQIDFCVLRADTLQLSHFVRPLLLLDGSILLAVLAVSACCRAIANSQCKVSYITTALICVHRSLLVHTATTTPLRVITFQLLSSTHKLGGTVILIFKVHSFIAYYATLQVITFNFSDNFFTLHTQEYVLIFLKVSRSLATL